MSGDLKIINLIDPDPANGYVSEISDGVVEIRVYTCISQSPTLARFCTDAEDRKMRGFEDGGIWVPTPFTTDFMCLATLDEGYEMARKWFIKEWG